MRITVRGHDAHGASSSDGALSHGVARERLRAVDARLRQEYGSPEWQSSGDPLGELVSTILSQHTTDINTERAYRSLRQHFASWYEVVTSPTDDVAAAITCGGLANVKAPRIQAVLREVAARFGALSLDALSEMPLDEARAWLVGLPGVGPKTAACVLLFSLGRPTMPVDTHVHRTTRRLGLIGSATGAGAAHRELNALIGPNRDAIYALHMNLIAHGRRVCRARAPACAVCALRNHCPSADVASETA